MGDRLGIPGAVDFFFFFHLIKCYWCVGKLNILCHNALSHSHMSATSGSDCAKWTQNNGVCTHIRKYNTHAFWHNLVFWLEAGNGYSYVRTYNMLYYNAHQDLSNDISFTCLRFLVQPVHHENGFIMYDWLSKYARGDHLIFSFFFSP